MKVYPALIIALFSSAILICNAEMPAQKPEFPDYHRVSCIGKVRGCPCFTRPEQSQAYYSKKNKKKNQEGSVLSLYHTDSVEKEGAPVKGQLKIKKSNQSCWYPKKRLKQLKYAHVMYSPIQQKMDHSMLPLHKLVKGLKKGDSLPADLQKQPLGYFWPTYYNLALEDFFPGPLTDVRNKRGKKLGRASKRFLKEVRWQGSGISARGLRLHWAGVTNRFNLYSKKRWGHGAGYGYHVSPYRTIAVNFKAFCKKLGKKRFKRCRKKQAIGLMVYIPEIAKRKIKMPGGQIHDGYFCATDTGSPYYIRGDRIDIFVGTMGGGNPYLPPERRGNALYDAGFRSLIPSDWRLWDYKDKRVWCPKSRIPRDPHNPRKGDCSYDYHITASHKALTMYALFQKNGKPLRCRKRI